VLVGFPALTRPVRPARGQLNVAARGRGGSKLRATNHNTMGHQTENFADSVKLLRETAYKTARGIEILLTEVQHMEGRSSRVTAPGGEASRKGGRRARPAPALNAKPREGYAGGCYQLKILPCPPTPTNNRQHSGGMERMRGARVANRSRD